MIIVEGIDGSGKSFLVKRLSKDLGIPTFRFKGVPEDREEFERRCITTQHFLTAKIICDRIPHISESIYGHLRSVSPFISWESSQATLKVFNPLVIYCRPLNHFIHNPESYDTSDHLQTVKSNWKILLSLYDLYMIQIKAIKYDWTNSIENILYDKIVKKCKAKLVEF